MYLFGSTKSDRGTLNFALQNLATSNIMYSAEVSAYSSTTEVCTCCTVPRVLTRLQATRWS
jgi:hypothetical protein